MSRVPLSFALNLLRVVTVITLQGLLHIWLDPYLHCFYVYSFLALTGAQEVTIFICPFPYLGRLQDDFRMTLG